MILGQFQFRRDTAANWTSVNPILLSGEFGLETDTDLFKIGDGTTAWNMLPYGGLEGSPGPQGDPGPAGRGIVSITRTAGNGAAGTSDTYTITYTEGPTSTFTVRNGSSVVVGATNTITPATNPSVTDADAGENVSLTFNLPRARNVTAGTTTTGAAGTSASVSSATNGDGDVTLNFTIPRGDTGQTGPAANAFTNIAVAGQNTVSAETANDTLTLVAGTNISLTTSDLTDSITISSTLALQNSFAVITGNTGTATADTPSDTLAITGGAGISTAASDTPDSLVITNTGVTSVTAGTGIGVSGSTGSVTITNNDTGSAARTAHEAAADPHPQYLTQAEGDALYIAQGTPLGPQFVSAVHTATQANNTTTAQDLTNQVFTVPPGKTARIQGNLIFTAAATSTGAFYGFRVAQGAGANGNAIGSWNAEVALTSAASATGLADGDVFNVAGGATTASGVLGTASTAGNNSAWIMLTVRNTSTNVNTTVALQFRSEVNLSAVTAQIGTSAAAVIG